MCACLIGFRRVPDLCGAEVLVQGHTHGHTGEKLTTVSTMYTVYTVYTILVLPMIYTKLILYILH